MGRLGSGHRTGLAPAIGHRRPAHSPPGSTHPAPRGVHRRARAPDAAIAATAAASGAAAAQ